MPATAWIQQRPLSHCLSVFGTEEDGHRATWSVPRSALWVRRGVFCAHRHT